MFSDAINSIWLRCRPSSFRSAALSSGSRSATVAWKNASAGRVARLEFSRGMIVRDWGSGQFGDAPLMAAAFELGAEKGAQAVLGDLEAHHARAERQDVGVVVLPREARGRGVVADARAHRPVPIGRDRDPDPGAAHEYAAPSLAPLDRARERVGEVRIIHGVATVGPEIQHLESQGLELGNE